MKKLKLILMVLFMSTTALVIYALKESNENAKNVDASSQIESYTEFDIFSKYNLY